MTVEVKEISKRTTVETAEDDLPAKLTPSGITSEIDYLKRLKIKAQILSYAGSGSDRISDQEKSIASFKSSEDKRIEKYYSKLIEVYNASTVDLSPEKARNPDDSDTKKKLDNKMKLAYLYSIYGYKDLYQLAHDLSEVERVQNSNEEVKALSGSLGLNR